jgi:hypothetical protein
MRKNKVFLAGMTALALAFVIAAAGCQSEASAVQVPKPIMDEINAIKYHKVEPGEKVNILEIPRAGSLMADFNNYDGGEWYKAHQNKLVSVEPIANRNSWVFYGRTDDIWRIGYVD